MADENSKLTFGIGDSDSEKSHVAFNYPEEELRIQKFSINLTVDNLSDEARESGLNFFALQVDFPNGTWAHGGPQSHQVNWGGLAYHGNMTSDNYTKPEPEKDILLIQNAENAIRNQPFEVQVNKQYTLSVFRGHQKHFPPGIYSVSEDSEKVTVDHERVLWQWYFTIEPVDNKGPYVQSYLYNSAEYILYGVVWNECGYGSCGKGQHTLWSEPAYTNLAGKHFLLTDWYRL
ncbi:hypothetical protein [Pantoea sp. B65]|uniref:hypothetical protein n=1 Tax=Pantoea sp. B65 TaxID=2813359 RepID=UPI0039B57D1F